LEGSFWKGRFDWLMALVPLFGHLPIGATEDVRWVSTTRDSGSNDEHYDMANCGNWNTLESLTSQLIFSYVRRESNTLANPSTLTPSIQ